nr:hypothetical protein [Tanacetum cinerariifolium]
MNMGQDRQMQMVESNGENQFRQNANQNGNGNLVAARGEGNVTGQSDKTQLLIAQKEEAKIQLQVEEFDLMAAAADLDEIEEVNANYGSAENDNNVISEVTSVEQSRGTEEQHPTNVEETRVLYDLLYHNLAIKVEKVNTVNRKLKETNAELTTELARFKNQEKFVEISQEKYEKLERCYQKSVYQEQCLSKKINVLYLSSGKQIMTLNEEISDLNKQISKEKSTVSFLLKEKKRLKSDFKIREDELLDKQIQLEKKIKELDNILVSVQKDNTRGTSTNTKFAKQSIVENLSKVGETHALSKPVNSNSTPTPQESKVMKNDKVIGPGMFRINLFKTYREEKHVPNKVRESARTKPITVSQPHIFTKKDVNSDSNGLSSTRIDNTKTRMPQPRSNTKNDRVPSTSKSSCTKNKGVEVEEHHRNLLLSKNKKHMSSACNNVKLATQNVKSKVIHEGAWVVIGWLLGGDVVVKVASKVLASVFGFVLSFWWFLGLSLVLDDMPYSCLIEYPRHSALTARI